MLDEILNHGVAAFQWDLRVTIVVSILSVFVLTHIITSFQSNVAFYAANGSNDKIKKPIIISYAIPMAGNLFSFAFDTKSFISNIIKVYGPNRPARVKVLNMHLNLISGADNVLAMFRGSRDLTTTPSSILVLENAFGTPRKVRHVFERDNTGVFKEPLEGSNDLEPNNRIFYLTHKSLHFHLTGAVGLHELASHFMKFLEVELEALDIGHDEWTDIPDLYKLIKEVVFKASTTALCGPTLFKLNPNFASDFWEFDTHMPVLFKSVPRWLVPNAFKCRDRMKASIMKWHAYAREHFDKDDEAVRKSEWEELYGARLIRERQSEWAEIDGYDKEAQAANDLGMVWGANANIVPIIGWTLIDTLLRPELLTQAQAEIRNAVDESDALSMTKLTSSPLLQSIYAEELRLRTGVFIQRVPVVDTFKIGSWAFPKDQMIVASSWHQQRDRTVWNEGPSNGGFHSVEDFWAERFIVDPKDPSSGPAKPGKDSKSKVSAANKEGDDKPKFTVEPVTGSWIPYGGGQKVCPGRFYAKQEAIGAMALFLTMFDIDLLGDEKPQPDLKYFAFGVIPPLGKFPARMRRRRV